MVDVDVQQRERLIEAIDRVATAIKEGRTIVPMFIYIPQSIRPDELEKIGAFMTEQFAKAGFKIGDEGA